MSAIAEEMAPHAIDIASGDAAAEPVIEAVEAGRRYVVTHGATV